jgi:hypothetical protein
MIEARSGSEWTSLQIMTEPGDIIITCLGKRLTNFLQVTGNSIWLTYDQTCDFYWAQRDIIDCERLAQALRGKTQLPQKSFCAT